MGFDIRRENDDCSILRLSRIFSIQRLYHQNEQLIHALPNAGEKNPVRAPIFSGISLPHFKKPIKPSFSVRVENPPNYSPVCQNETVLHLTWWLSKPPESSCILPYTFTHRNPQTLPEHQCEDIFNEAFFNSCFLPASGYLSGVLAPGNCCQRLFLSSNITPDSQMDRKSLDF